MSTEKAVSMLKHAKAHPLSGQMVRLTAGEWKGSAFDIEDWNDRVFGKTWMFMDWNPCALEYAMRSAHERSPTDNEVVYGKLGAFAKLIHVDQLGEVIEETP